MQNTETAPALTPEQRDALGAALLKLTPEQTAQLNPSRLRRDAGIALLSRDTGALSLSEVLRAARFVLELDRELASVIPSLVAPTAQ